jgi:hypothetical protein
LKHDLKKSLGFEMPVNQDLGFFRTPLNSKSKKVTPKQPVEVSNQAPKFNDIVIPEIKLDPIEIEQPKPIERKPEPPITEHSSDSDFDLKPTFRKLEKQFERKPASAPQPEHSEPFATFWKPDLSDDSDESEPDIKTIRDSPDLFKVFQDELKNRKPVVVAPKKEEVDSNTQMHLSDMEVANQLE